MSRVLSNVLTWLLPLAAAALVGLGVGALAVGQTSAQLSPGSVQVPAGLMLAAALGSVAAATGWAHWRGVRGVSLSTASGLALGVCGLGLSAGWWIGL